MISREVCAAQARALHAHPGVRRVIFAGADGIPHVDDGVLEDRERAAAAAATLAGVALLFARGLGLDDPEGTVIYGGDQQAITRVIDEDLLLVVLADAGERGTGVYRAVRRVARTLAEASHAAPSVTATSR